MHKISPPKRRKWHLRDSTFLTSAPPPNFVTPYAYGINTTTFRTCTTGVMPSSSDFPWDPNIFRSVTPIQEFARVTEYSVPECRLLFKMAICLRRLRVLCRIKTVHMNSSPAICRYSDNIIDRPDMGPPIPPYQKREGETSDVKKARLLYQSRLVPV